VPAFGIALSCFFILDAHILSIRTVSFWAALLEWEKEGGQAFQLIEPVDGFHPSQVRCGLSPVRTSLGSPLPSFSSFSFVSPCSLQWAQPLITEFFWRYLENEHKTSVPPINPNNAKIASLFGDQGGY
jgi:acyloxyacyl hydrolase